MKTLILTFLLLFSINISVSQQTTVSRTIMQYAGTYSATPYYSKGDVVNEGNTLYLSPAGQNHGHDPASSPSYWQVISSVSSTTVAVGTTTTLSPGSPATATNGGNSSAVVLNFGIPQGVAGSQGPPVTFRGSYNPGTTYGIGDAVAFTDGSSYISLQASNTGHAPNISSSQWALLAQAGATGATGPAGTGSSSIAYASQASGATPVASIAQYQDTTGYPDSTSALNTAMATLAAAGGSEYVVDKKYGLGGSLQVPSGMKLRCLDGDGFIALVGNNQPMIMNKTTYASPSSCMATTASGDTDPAGTGYIASNFCDHDITVQGCIFNSNTDRSGLSDLRDSPPSSTAYWSIPTYGLWIPTQWWHGVTNLKLIDNLVVDPHTYAYVLCNTQHVLMQNSSTTQTSPSTHTNTDAVHLNCPNDDVEIAGLHVTNNNDDTVAINANDGADASAGGAYPSVAFPGIQHGRNTNINVHDVVCNLCYMGFRLLSTGQLIQHVRIANVRGTTVGAAFQADNFQFGGNPYMDDVVLSNVNLEQTTNSIYGLNNSTYKGSYIFDCGSGTCSNFVLNNVTFPSLKANGNVAISVQSGYVPLTVNGLKISNPVGNTQNTTAVIQNLGSAAPWLFNGVDWKDAPGNTGFLFGGVNGPSQLTGSGFLGDRTRVASFNVAPGATYGDAFATSVTPATVTYISTTFNEASSGAALAGTSPAVNTPGGTWLSNASSASWAYGTSQIVSGTANPAYAIIDSGHTSGYVIRATMTPPAGFVAGFQMYWNVTDANNFDALLVSPSQLQLYHVAGSSVTLEAANNTCGSTSGANAITVSVQAASVNASVGSCTISSAFPTPTASKVGINDYNGTAGIQVSSFSVKNQ